MRIQKKPKIFLVYVPPLPFTETRSKVLSGLCHPNEGGWYKFRAQWPRSQTKFG